MEGLNQKIVAGYIWTSEIAGDPNFHGIYYDGQSHYYIDGNTLKTDHVPILMIDTETDTYYELIDGVPQEILPYDEGTMLK